MAYPDQPASGGATSGYRALMASTAMPAAMTCAPTNAGAGEGAIPANVLENMRLAGLAGLAGLAKLVELVKK